MFILSRNISIFIIFTQKCMSKSIIPNEPQYRQFLDEIKTEIRQAKIRVARSANRELIQLYWRLGKAITDKQEALSWGKSVVEQLARDL